MLFFHNATPEGFFGILLISRGATKTARIVPHSQSTSTFPKYCGSSWAQAIMSALSDRIKMARGAQVINVQLSVQHTQTEPKPISTFPQNETLAVACWDTSFLGLSSGSRTLDCFLVKCYLG